MDDINDIAILLQHERLEDIESKEHANQLAEIIRNHERKLEEKFELPEGRRKHDDDDDSHSPSSEGDSYEQAINALRKEIHDAPVRDYYS